MKGDADSIMAYPAKITKPILLRVSKEGRFLRWGFMTKRQRKGRKRRAEKPRRRAGAKTARRLEPSPGDAKVYREGSVTVILCNLINDCNRKCELLKRGLRDGGVVICLNPSFYGEGDAEMVLRRGGLSRGGEARIA